MVNRSFQYGMPKPLYDFLNKNNLFNKYKVIYSEILDKYVAIPIVSDNCKSVKYMTYTVENSKIITLKNYSINYLEQTLPYCNEDTDADVLQCKKNIQLISKPLPKQCYQYTTKTSCTTSKCKWSSRLDGSSEAYITMGSTQGNCCDISLYNSHTKSCQNPPIIGNWYYQYGELCPPLNTADASGPCSSGCYSDVSLGSLFVNNRPTTIKLDTYLDNSYINAAFYLGNGFIPGPYSSDPSGFYQSFGTWGKNIEGQTFIKHPQNTIKDPFETYPYQIINFGGWGFCGNLNKDKQWAVEQYLRATYCDSSASSNPNAVWDVTTINYLPSKDDIISQGFNGVSIDIESAWGDVSSISNMKEWKKDHPRATYTNKTSDLDISINVIGNYKMSDNENKAFADALNNKLESYKGLLRFIILQGDGLTNIHGGMGWFNLVNSDNYEYVIPMYYANINDTGSDSGANTHPTDMPNNIEKTWTTNYKVPANKIIIGYSLGNQGGASDPLCDKKCSDTCRKTLDKPKDWLSKDILEKASAGVTNWAYYGGIVKWGNS